MNAKPSEKLDVWRSLFSTDAECEDFWYRLSTDQKRSIINNRLGVQELQKLKLQIQEQINDIDNSAKALEIDG